MRKREYYKQDWFIALLVAIVFGTAVLTRNDLLQRLELAAYDIGVRMTHRASGASDQIVIVAIDDQSIAELGRWPWPRSVLAEGLERLSKSEPRAVGLLFGLTESQNDPGLSSIRDIREKLSSINMPKQARAQLGELRTLLNQTEKQLDTDRAMAQALRTTPHLYLRMFVDWGKPSDTKAPEYIHRYGLSAPTPSPMESIQSNPITGIQPPLEQFGRYARGIGHLSFRLDADKGARAFHSAFEYNGRRYLSLPILLTASSLGVETGQIEYEAAKGIKLGKLFVPTDSEAQTYIGFYQPPSGKDRTFTTYSFNELRADKLSPSLFANKIVLIGSTATGIGPQFTTPITADKALMPEPELAANAITSILNEDFYTVPNWAAWVEPNIVLILMLYLILALPRMSGRTALLVSLLLMIGLLGTEQFLMVTQKTWLQTTSPALLLLIGHLAIVAKRFVLGERIKAETDSAHTNRMLGLALQSQGQLDMAMDKFRKLPVDESVLDLIYNLALDFERKRQFHKAVSAYDYILEHHWSFRDCADRKKRASQGDQVMVLGKTLILDGTEKPTLGRYRIEKELGRGEMGVVYLGLDPKINRRVAIKTMSLSHSLEEKEISDLRERFFREAETAGRLHHPNIVTIYDLGEEHDLAYIAMEYLEGKELSAHIQPGKPLPFDWILNVAIQVADALAYAHRNDVVHRDIKPSNIVYHEATGTVKVTDFGIARIIAANRTKTGTVLGTPAYMSPEQISGKRVDGRSDLYALGSMLFEMVAGDTPFDGDSFAALMHQIINAPAPDIRKVRSDTPENLAAIIKRLLQKQAGKRYQTGEELKEALEQCRSSLNETAKA